MKLLRVGLILLAFVVAGVLAVLTLVVAVQVGSTPAPVWTSSSGKPVPDDFRVVCYPMSEKGRDGGGIRLYDKPGGTPIGGGMGTLQRALANTVAEMAGTSEGAAGWIGVNSGNGEMLWVRRTELRYEPPVDATIDYDAALMAAKEKAGFFNVTVKRERRGDGVVTVQLEMMPDDDHVEGFTYTVANNTVTPVEMHRYFGPGEAFKNIPQFIVALASAGAVGVCALVGGVVVAVRVTRRRVRSAER